MRTTVQVRHVDADLWRKAKAQAMLDKLSLKALIERLLADYLKGSK